MEFSRRKEKGLYKNKNLSNYGAPLGALQELKGVIIEARKLLDPEEKRICALSWALSKIERVFRGTKVPYYVYAYTRDIEDDLVDSLDEYSDQSLFSGVSNQDRLKAGNLIKHQGLDALEKVYHSQWYRQLDLMFVNRKKQAILGVLG